MISSPGCLCRTTGASGPSSTRFWITMRPGTLSSCSCRSVRLIPGACWSCHDSSLADGLEGGPQLGGEELRLLPRGEVAALLDFVEVHERRIDRLYPAARRPED